MLGRLLGLLSDAPPSTQTWFGLWIDTIDSANCTPLGGCVVSGPGFIDSDAVSTLGGAWMVWYEGDSLKVSADPPALVTPFLQTLYRDALPRGLGWEQEMGSPGTRAYAAISVFEWLAVIGDVRCDWLDLVSDWNDVVDSPVSDARKAVEYELLAGRYRGLHTTVRGTSTPDEAREASEAFLVGLTKTASAADFLSAYFSGLGGEELRILGNQAVDEGNDLRDIALERFSDLFFGSGTWSVIPISCN